MTQVSHLKIYFNNKNVNEVITVNKKFIKT